MSDCPECEYCCLTGLCCPPAQQKRKLIAFFAATGAPLEECEKYADAFVAARIKAQEHGSKT